MRPIVYDVTQITSVLVCKVSSAKEDTRSLLGFVVSRELATGKVLGVRAVLARIHVLVLGVDAVIVFPAKLVFFTTLSRYCFRARKTLLSRAKTFESDGIKAGTVAAFFRWSRFRKNDAEDEVVSCVSHDASSA